MAQWVNRLRNKIFVKPPPLSLLCEISGALHRSYGRLADEIQVNFEIFKVGCSRIEIFDLSFRLTKVQPYQCIPAGFFG